MARRGTDDDRRKRVEPEIRPVPAGAAAGRARLVSLPALLLTLGFASDARRSEAYRLYDNGSADFIATSAEAIRWAPEIWAPGAELEWRLEPAPEWNEGSDSAERALAGVREALAHWSAVPGADIRWTVAGLSAASAGEWVRDAAHRVFLSTDGANLGAGVWFRRSASGTRWEISECDVGATIGGGGELAVGTLAEDLAACLGLGPSAGAPTSRRLRTERPPDDDPQARNNGYWGSPSVDSPLWSPDRDRQVGAALLRPQESWRETVGSISGSLVAGGEPAPYAHVWAFRVGGPLGDPVGAFSNRSGAFLIEGLEPGRYLLWAHPVAPSAHRLVGVGGRTEVKDAVRLRPVSVTAGETADGLVLTLPTGRDHLVP